MGMHYERAARDEATLQKDCRKRNFLKSGERGAVGARGGRADREGVCEMRLCNCSDIFIESPPSLSCVLQRASLMPVDGESSRGAVFSIIPEAIVRAASERLTVASWDFTKIQQNTRRKGWDLKIRGGGGGLGWWWWWWLGGLLWEKCRCVTYYITGNEDWCFVRVSVPEVGSGC